MMLTTRIETILREAARHRKAIDTYICEGLAACLVELEALHPRHPGGAGADGQVIDVFKPWLREARRILLARGWLREEEGCFVLQETARLEGGTRLPRPDPEWLADPYQSASVRLVQTCLEALPQILRGERKPTDVLFPASSTALVEGIYKGNPVADFFNDALSEVLLRAVQARLAHDPSARLRLLEVGAGTGGTTDGVLRRLAACQDHIEEYCYTDVSRVFLQHAEGHYCGDYPFLGTALFDVETPAGRQGIEPARFDFVIASNVVHATRNIGRTLRNIKTVLRTSGILLLNELTRKSPATHVTFGLLGGWWQVEDPELRNEGSPSLPVESWRKILRAEGYRSFLAPVGAVEADLGQQIIAVESDGIVRSSPAGARLESDVVRAPSPRDNAPEADTSPIEYVTQILSACLKLDPQQIDPDEPLGNYGLDSILIGQLAHRLQQDFARVTPTLFFEKRTARELADGLMAAYPEELRKITRAPGPAALPEAPTAPSEAPARPLAAPASDRPPPHEGARSRSAPIAIIGLSGRYPGANSVAQYWENLRDGRDCITQVPPDRWRIESFYEPDPDQAVAAGRSYSKWGGFLENVRAFDPMFFNLSPREAVAIDPQERLFLECCWEVLEDAGYTRATLAASCDSRVGVYVGITRTGFELFGPALWSRGERLYPRTSFSSAANRVSYFLDLKGPSLAIDTMCSSSLVAIHEACSQLKQGECELAIAGGVNLYLHPSTYVGLCAARMLSADGRSRSFGQGASGFVPGEGVGAVLLKPLSRAVADGDRIHAVIRGSRVNHGGRTNGFTVPNPNAQSQLVLEALTDAGIDARHVGYVESHGTGTELGDPIEIAGLSEAFRHHTQETGFCRVGSVKSNIGHLEAAAGIAGLTKLVLQLRHRQLVPSLHARELNPNIPFAQTPFIVQQHLEPWRLPADAEGEAPLNNTRVAGISSFGAGGANAHLIMEEYVDGRPDRYTPVVTGPFVVVLSARTKGQLEQVARNLSDHLKRQTPPHVAKAVYLSDLAYTLQIGREAMEERLACLVSSLEELERELAAFLDGSPASDSRVQGRVRRHYERRGSFTSDEELLAAVEEWLASKNYSRVIEAWVRGAQVPWQELYSSYAPEARPRRIALPTYPFSREEYWFEATTEAVRDTPDSATWSCTWTLDGSESFLRDHVIRGRKVLPAVAYLEMVRAALAKRQPADTSAPEITRLTQIVWSTPLEVSQPTSVRITFSKAPDRGWSWEFHSLVPESRAVLHAEGRAERLPREAETDIRVPEIQGRMRRGQLSSADCYHAFRRVGIEYGTSHRGIRCIFVGEEQVLAELWLPQLSAETGDHPVLPPGMLDSALQSCIGLVALFADGRPDLSSLPAALPFALREVQINGACTQGMWAWIRPTASPAEGGAVGRLDVDLCDLSGRVVVRMRGLTTRAIDERRREPASLGSTLSELDCTARASREPALLVPEWVPGGTPAAGSSSHLPQRRDATVWQDRHIVLCGLHDAAAVLTARPQPGVSACINIRSAQQTGGGRFADYSVAMLDCIGQLRCKERATLLQVVVSDADPGMPGLSGLLRTAQLENDRLLVQLLQVPERACADELASWLAAATDRPYTSPIRHVHGTSSVLRWKELSQSAHTPVMPWREGRVYLLTGGLGGLARILAHEIVRSCPSSTVVLCGRRRVDELELERLGLPGKIPTADRKRIIYQCADVARQADVEELVSRIRAQHGALHGLIHMAGIHRDRPLQHKTAEELRQVLAPKVAGTLHLDSATQALPLDFFVLWSSGAGVFGNPGQGDYAAANAFMDDFAHWRNALVASGRRMGHTLSLDWPQWEAGGMHVGSAARRRLAERFGLEPMSSQAGLAALYRGMQSMQSQILVVSGHADRVLDVLNGTASRAAPAGPVSGDPAKARAALRQGIATILRLRPQDIENDVELADLGFDSVLLTEFARSLNQQYGLTLDPTLFFDHPVLEDLAAYLARAFPEPFAAAQQSGEVMQEAPVEPRTAVSDLTARETRRPATSEPIAIVGISAEFPMAPTLEALWDNLLSGRDCITEIPAQRWSWEALLGDPRTQRNRTRNRWGGFIEGADKFDPLFFGISPREAELMDPQQRLLMTHVYLALEEAGYDPLGLAGSETGIFVGTGNSGYGPLALKAGHPVDAYTATSIIPSIGPNRMSFFLDLHGPSEPIETACSSALVAIHRAVEAIRDGRCNAALAGGVMTLVTPDGHISFEKAGMLSPDGRCKPFSAHANGYVRAEGVGILMLKPLSVALAEGAHVHGLIRATAVNHGGRASSLTAPNPKAQAALLKQAYREAGIDPRTVSYIETHGTGTPLGDPIEINALKSAFKELCDATRPGEVPEPRCGLGSVKSNIGHLEMAAGVAGVIKVLLQMKHQTLVKTLHCEEPNPYIDFAGTPFYLVTENQQWSAYRNDRGEYLPRRAGVSSFGFGGVNAHVVLEEYVPESAPEAVPSWPEPVIVPLSARTERQLREIAIKLLTVLPRQAAAEESAPEISRDTVTLADLAYTLQVGRAALEQRMAVIASSLEELRIKLEGFVQAAQETDGLFLGQSIGNTEAVATFREDEELREAVEKWFRRRKLPQLAQLWVKGLALDWRRLYGDRMPRRISLPGYPFAQERYWIEHAALVNGSSSAMNSGLESNLPGGNPLLPANTSDFSGLRFTLTLSGSEPFLADHRVGRQRTLPGVAYLETVRAAVLAAAGPCAEGRQVQLRNVVWLRPLIVEAQPQTLHLRMLPETSPSRQPGDSPLYRCEASSREHLVHMQCLAELVPAAQPGQLNLPDIKSRLSHAVLDGQECYRRFTQLGIEYGPSHQAIESLSLGRGEVLARLRLPQAARMVHSSFVLHPSLMDAALQAMMGLTDPATPELDVRVPFSMQRLTLFRPCSECMWAWVRQSGPATVDIDLCDDEGHLCVGIQQLTSRVLDPGSNPDLLLKPQSVAPQSSTFSCHLSGEEFFIADHMRVVPGVAYLEMARAASDLGRQAGAFVVEKIVWPEPLALGKEPVELTLSLREHEGHVEFSVTTARTARAARHAQGRVAARQEAIAASAAVLDLQAIRSRCAVTLEAQHVRELLADAPHGPTMMPLERLQIGGAEALVTLRMPAALAGRQSSFVLHPSLLHGVLLSAVVFAAAGRPNTPVELPFSMESLCVHGRVPDLAFVHVVRVSSSGHTFSMEVADEHGRVCLSIRELTTVPVKRQSPPRSGGEHSEHTTATNPSRRLDMPRVDTMLRDRVGGDLRQIVATLQKIPLDRIRGDVELSKYGLDSIGLTELANVLNARYGLALLPTVFFEHPTLQSLAHYLASAQAEPLRRHFQSLSDSATPVTPTAAPVTHSAAPEEAFDRRIEKSDASTHPAGAPRAGSATSATVEEPFAIVGMSARLPGATDPAEFWEHLAANADLIRTVPESRWNWRQCYGDPLLAPDKTYVNAGGFIDDADCFDSLFFGISPREAETMDPQQRLFLETAWACLEDAGYRSSDVAKSRTGVFVGVSTSDYRDLCLLQDTSPEAGAGATFHFEIANRVSYLLNLHGPSAAIDTACSSSLIALHRSLESLRSGSCEAALVGGVNLIANPRLMIDMSRAGMLSRDGRCKTFDRRADGYGRGEGVGAVLVKPLSAAIAGHDHIYALIRGSAENHGGRANSMTAPNPLAQQDLIVTAYTRAGISPATVSYVETHGTGTELGDPVEINGLKGAFSELCTAFAEAPPARPHCALGSVKTNIGHLEAAAGISALVKVLLMFQHRRIPGNGQLAEPNPYMRLEGSPFHLARQTLPWEALPSADGPVRRAGISSFGVGGSNAHVILEEFDPARWACIETPLRWPQPEYLIPLSARSPDRLVAYAEKLRGFLDRAHAQVAALGGAQESVWLARIARTLQTGRDAMSCRVAFVIGNARDLLDGLGRFARGDKSIPRCWRGSLDSTSSVGQGGGSASGAEVFTAAARFTALEEYAQHWVRGAEIDWSRLYGDWTPERISLPTYPFARVRHWLPVQRLPVQPLPTLTGPAQPSQPLSAPSVIMASPAWQPSPPLPPDAPVERLVRTVVWCPMGATVSGQLEEHLPGIPCLRLQSQQVRLDACFTERAMGLFEIVRDILTNQLARLPAGHRFLLQLAVPQLGDSRLLAALAALLRSASQENPAFLGQLVLVAGEDSAPAVAEKLDACARTPGEVLVRYRGTQPERLYWVDIADLPAQSLTPAEPFTPWRNAGVYLITGGLGGLGRIFAREILRRTENATLVLAGRSELDPVQCAQLAQLQECGSVRYERVDVSQPTEVEALIANILRRHGGLHGIIHAAGINLDNYLLRKSAEEFRQVLASKVAGTVHLDHATRHLDIDLFVLFSSGTGACGNAGQADYATANAFMDEYARYREGEVASGKGRGKTVAFNWSLWSDGGMRVDPAAAEYLYASLGLVAMDTPSGLQAFYKGLGCGQSQVMVVAGDPRKIHQAVFGGSLQTPRQGVEAAGDPAVPDSLRTKVLTRLQEVIAELIKVPAAELAPQARLDQFGLDSMMVTRLTQRLWHSLGEIPKTLLYEHKTLADLTEYLVSAHGEACTRWIGEPQVRRADVRKTSGPAVEDAPDTRVQAPRPAAGGGGQREPIAIVGMAGRYASARNLEELWERLTAGEPCITEIPQDRWPLAAFYEADVERAVSCGRSYSKWGGFLEGFAAFDPLFFNLAAKDALAISPQERVFLESCWHALEDSGLRPSQFSEAERARIGVYGAVTKGHANTSFASLVNRVSFVMDLRGPSLAVDTKCSSTLTAVHYACEALAREEIDIALVGAVNLYLDPQAYIELSRTRLMADSPRAAVFGDSSRGFVPGEGVGAIVLKRCADAVRAGHDILALIRATAVNHNGRTMSYGVPDPQQQAAVVRRTWTAAGIDPRSVAYIESAANGSEVGDAIEVSALQGALVDFLAERETPVRIGSLKPVLGHAEAASGMAQLMKVVLQLRHRTFCPTLYSDVADPDTGPFELQRVVEEWKPISVEGRTLPRRAAIHSTGAGGVNAHAILEEPTPRSEQHRQEPKVAGPVLFVLSAKTESALRDYLDAWHRYLLTHREVDLERLAYTLQQGREAMKYRFACVTQDPRDLSNTLGDALSNGDNPRSLKGVVQGGSASRDGSNMAPSLDPSAYTTSPDLLMKIARTWVAGEAVNWLSLYPAGAPALMTGLPVYPFSRKPYWRAPSVPIPAAIDDSHNTAAEAGGDAEPATAAEPAAAAATRPQELDTVTHTRAWVRSIVNELLEFSSDEEIDADANFAEMGFDSVSIVKFVEVLRDRCGVELEVTAPFNYPSINELARHISQQARAPGPAGPVTPEPEQQQETPTTARASEENLAVDLHPGGIRRNDERVTGEAEHPAASHAPMRPASGRVLNLESLLMDLAQDDLDLEEALGMLEAVSFG